jgi:hypothetical protein
MGQPETTTLSVAWTLAGDVPDDEVGLYPCVDAETYDTHIYPRVIMARELARASNEVRDEVFCHGWSDHVTAEVTIPLFNHPAAVAARKFQAEHAAHAYSMSSAHRNHVRVHAARTDLGWLVWTGGAKANQTRFMAFESLGHLVQALADDPCGYFLMPLVEALVAPRLAQAHWTLLHVQFAHWCHLCDENVPDYTCPQHWAANRPKRLLPRLVQKVIGRHPEDRLPALHEGDCSSCHTSVQVPSALYEMKGLAGRDSFWVGAPSRKPLAITSVNKPLSDDTLTFVSYDRALSDLSAWEEAVKGVCPDITERGGLPDGWHHVRELAATRTTSLHLVRSSGDWVVVLRELGSPRHPVDMGMITAAHTLGHLTERYAEWVAPRRAWADTEVYTAGAEVLHEMCRGLLQGLPVEEVDAENFLSALGGRVPAVAFEHRVTDDAISAVLA